MIKKITKHTPLILLAITNIGLAIKNGFDALTIISLVLVAIVLIVDFIPLGGGK